MDIKLIIFDLDGVLCDTPDMHYETFSKALKEFTGITVTKKEHDLDFNGLSTKLKLKILQNTHRFTDEIVNKIWIRKQELTEFFIDTYVHIDEEKIRLLKSLKDSGRLLCCASNCIRTTLDKILTRLGIIELFDKTFSNEDVENPKPSSEIYLKAMIYFNCNPANTLIVEDSKVGFIAAKNTNSEVFRVTCSQEVTLKTVQNKLNKIKRVYMPTLYENVELNIVIPMAGAGSRFEQAGFSFPKPLIEVFQKPMIQLVVESLNIKSNFIYIVRDEHLSKYSLKEFLEQITPGCTVVSTDGITDGAACTVLLAKNYINNQNPIIIANSDQYIEWDVFDFIKDTQLRELDASILTFESTHPKWSFVKTNDLGFVTEVAEKKPISNLATVGIYWWKKGSDFVKFAEQMISKNIRVNNEFYVCPVFNEAIVDQRAIGVYKVDEMWGLGTPEDLEYFTRNKK